MWDKMFQYGTTSDPLLGGPLTAGIGATSTSLGFTIVGTLFDALYQVMNLVLPYAVGILVFYIGYRFARRALAGR